MPTADRPWRRCSRPPMGVAARGVSPYPGSVTKQMVDTFTAGKAAVNQICATFDAGLRVFDLALDLPTPDITEDAALDERACAATIAFGMAGHRRWGGRAGAWGRWASATPPSPPPSAMRFMRHG